MMANPPSYSAMQSTLPAIPKYSLYSGFSKAELAETKVTEEDAVKVMLKFSADNLIKLELITGSLEKQQQLQHQVNETNVKDATTTVVEHAKPSLKIVMHRPHAAPDSTTEGRKKEDGGEDPGMGIEVKQEVMVKEEETRQDTKPKGTGDKSKEVNEGRV